MTSELDTKIFVNGSLLTESETVVIKVALAHFLSDLQDLPKWGNDEKMRTDHITAIKRISKKMASKNGREYHD